MGWSLISVSFLVPIIVGYRNLYPYPKALVLSCQWEISAYHKESPGLLGKKTGAEGARVRWLRTVETLWTWLMISPYHKQLDL